MEAEKEEGEKKDTKKCSKGQIAYVCMFPERTDLQIPLIQTCL